MMTMSKGFYILVLILKFIAASTESEETLVLSHVLFRHGDRTPISIYPNDPYNETYWPEGLGQLTKLGKEMEYNLGKWLRKRYDKFIGKQYNYNEVNVRSTDFDRTLMSAQCVLASFYYPDEVERFNKSILWMPTSVHTVPIEYDMLLNVWVSCPRIAKEKELNKFRPEWVTYFSQHEKLFKYLSDHSGQVVNNLSSLGKIYDTLRIEHIYNLTLPDWTNGYMDQLREISEYSYEYIATTELKRLISGPLISEIRNHMDEKVKNSNASIAQKLFLYSGHDTTVAPLLNALGLYNGISPPYSSTLLIELYLKEESYFVKMFYKNDSSMTAEPHVLTLPGCNSLCPLHSWRHIVEHVVPEDWAFECDIPNHDRDKLYMKVLSGTLLILLMVAFLAAFLYLFYKKDSRGSEMYRRIRSDY